MKKIGFCKQCLRNVPHILFFRLPVFRWLNGFPRLLSLLPFGSWHCCGCEKFIWRLRMPDPNATTDVTSTEMSDVIPWPKRNDPSQRFGLLFRRKRHAAIVPDDINAKNASAESVVEHVGNFLRSDESLLVRKARANRYSAKFREGIVNRILSGALTISQARKELNVSERDLLDWINDRIMRQDQKISKLTQVVDSVQQLAIEGQLERDKAASARDMQNSHDGDSDQRSIRRPKNQGATIEGRVN